MGKYEILYIVHPDLEASIDKITGQVRGIIEKRGGKITYEENWGKRKLAYPIKKTEVGIYILWYFEAPKENLDKMERDIRLTEEVLRYMLLTAPEKVKVQKPVEKKTSTPTKAQNVALAPKKPGSAEKKPASKEPVSTLQGKTEKKTVRKPAKTVKEEAVKTPSEAERMKALDEKLGALLGDEEKDKPKKPKVVK